MRYTQNRPTPKKGRKTTETRSRAVTGRPGRQHALLHMLPPASLPATTRLPRGIGKGRIRDGPGFFDAACMSPGTRETTRPLSETRKTRNKIPKKWSTIRKTYARQIGAHAYRIDPTTKNFQTQMRVGHRWPDGTTRSPTEGTVPASRAPRTIHGSLDQIVAKPA